MNTSIDTAPPWALTNALLIDGTGEPAVAGATVVVTGNTITAVGDATVIPPGAQVVDLQGRTVLPGLIDAHVHLGGGGFGEGARFNGRASSGDYAAPRADALRYGVTTQRTLGDYLHDSVAVRDEIDAGTLRGARIVTSGASFQVRGGHPNSTVWANDETAMREAARFPTTPEEAVQAVKELAEAGVDLIKIIISNNAFDGTPKPELKFPWELTEAIVAAAHEIGLPVAAHVEKLSDALRAVRAGVDDIEHLVFRMFDDTGEDAFDELFALMAHKGTYLGATMVVRHHSAPVDVDPTTLHYGNRLIRRAFDAGVRISVGSDAHAPGQHGKRLFDELVMMVHDQGIPPLAALTAATGTNSELLRRSETIGSVTPGKLADLLVVDGNPLEEITDLARVHLVVLNGDVVVDNAGGVR
jgi:enamidase